MYADYLQQTQDTTQVFVKYATLSDYFSAMWAGSSASNITYPTNYGSDFFPLDEDLFWTVCPPSPIARANFLFKGYYTSRTALKGLTRNGEAVAHVVESLYVAVRNGYRSDLNITDMLSRRSRCLHSTSALLTKTLLPFVW